MRKILIVFFIAIFISLSGLNFDTSGSNNFRYNKDNNPQFPILTPASKSIGDLKQIGDGITICEDNVWLEYLNDFKNEEQRFDMEFGLPVVENDDEYSLISFPNCNYIQDSNKPMLPLRTLILNYPPGTKVVNVDFIPKSITKLRITNPILPAFEPLPITNGYEIYDDQIENSPKMDNSVYLNNELYPEDWFQYSTGMGLSPISNERVLFLVIHIYPVKYNPVQNNLFYLSSGELDVEVQESAGANNNDEEDRSDHGTTQQPITRSGDDGSRATSHDMIIFCPDIFEPELIDFAKHKTNTGIDTVIVTLGDIVSSAYFPVQGRDDAEKIKYFIFNAVKNWDIKYVLLVGDHERIPTRITHVQEQGLNDNEAADLYFADVFDSLNNFCDWNYDNDDLFGEYTLDNGNVDNLDLYPDVIIGRFPASSTSEVATLVDKTTTYEITAIGQAWYSNTVLNGLDTFSGGTAEGEYLSDYIARKYLQDFNNVKLYESTGTLTKENIKSYWNEGAGFVSFSDHGLHSNWGQIFSSTDVNSLTNGYKLPFVNYDACLTGEFDQGSSDCLAEMTILNSRGGGVAVVASSRIAYGSFGMSHINSASGFLNVRLYHNMYHNTKIAGALLHNAKIDYLNNLGTGSSTHFKTVIEYNYFGDPSLLLGGLPTAIFNLKCEDNTSSLEPGEKTEYVVQVENKDIQTRQITLSTSTPPDQWTVKLSKTSLSLLPHTNFNITLTVTVPTKAIANTKADITVIGALAGIERTICVGTKTIVKRIYGFEISSNSMPNASGEVDPGEMINFTFQIYNQGNAEEKISIDLVAAEEAGYYWEYQFSDVNLNILPYSKEDVLLSFRIPAETVAMVYTFSIQAKLISKSKTKNLELFVNVLRVCGVKINCSNPNQVTDPGVNLTFDIELENFGNRRETFEFIINDFPTDWGVRYKVDSGEVVNSTLEVGPFTVIDIKTVIKVVSGTIVGDYNLTLMVRCVDSEEEFRVYSLVGLNIKVNRVFGIAIKSPESEYYVGIDDKLSTYVEVTNLGNYKDYVKLEVASKPDGWTVLLDNYQNILFFANEMREIGVSIIPEHYTKVGTYYVYLRAILDGDNSIANLKIPIIIERMSGLNITNADPSVLYRPGETADFKILIINEGNDEDIITVSLLEESPFGKVTLDDTSQLRLKAFEEKEIGLTMELNEFVLAGNHTIPIMGNLASTNENYSFDIIFPVKLERGLDIDAVQKKIISKPGTEARVDIRIKNLGNIKEDYTLIVDGIPLSWKAKFPSPRTITIQAFSTLNETLYFEIPSDEPYHDVKLEIKVQSQEDSKINQILPITVSIQEEELLFFGISAQTLTILIIIIIILIVLIFGIIKLNKKRKMKGDAKSNILRYDRSSDGSRIVWEETTEPVGAQYNPPTPSPKGQDFDILVSAPETYRRRVILGTPTYQGYLSTPNYPVQNQYDGYIPYTINSDDLNYKRPKQDVRVLESTHVPQLGPSNIPETGPEVNLQVEEQPTPAMPAMHDIQPRLELKYDEEPDIEYHSKEDLSLTFNLPQSKSQPMKKGQVLNRKSQPQPVEKVESPSYIDSDEVEIFSIPDEISWKRPRNRSNQK